MIIKIIYLRRILQKEIKKEPGAKKLNNKYKIEPKKIIKKS